MSTYTADAIAHLRDDRARLEAELGALIYEKLAAFRERTGVAVEGVSVDFTEAHAVGEWVPTLAGVYARVTLRI
jgi:hypothetical protein